MIGCASIMFFALLCCSSLKIFFGWCCLSFLWMRCASDFSNGGLLAALLYISCSLSSLRLYFVQMRVPSCLCSEVCVGFVGCWVSSYWLVGWVSRSGLIGVVENVRLADSHPSMATGFIGGFFSWHGVASAFVVCMLAMRRIRFPCPWSLRQAVKPVPRVLHRAVVPRCCQVYLYVCSWIPRLCKFSFYFWVSISGIHWVTKYVVWL